MTVHEKSVDDDLFASDVTAIVNPVNCLGVSGLGLALRFKQEFPRSYRDYRAYCGSNAMKPGGILVTEEKNHAGVSISIIHMATKNHWRDPSRIEWVRNGVRAMRDWAEGAGCQSIACPALGSGLGGLNWERVREVVLTEFSSSGISLSLFPPKMGPAYGSRTVDTDGVNRQRPRQ